MESLVRAPFVLVLACTMTVVLTSARDGHAACPGVPCDCVGEGAKYRAVVLDRLLSNHNTVYGNLCAQVADLVEPPDDGQPDDLVGNLHVLAGPSELAVRGRINRAGPGDSIVVSGMLATGGGDVVGPISAGTIDQTGTGPGIASCQQASADIQAASAAMALLPPTQVLSHLIVDQPGATQFPVGPGVNVIEVENRIAIRDGVLEIVLDPATDAVVFNTRAFSMKRFTRIFVSGGDDTKVLINIPGTGPAVVLKRDVWAAPVIFAPERTVRVVSARFASIFADRLILRRALVDQLFDTCASPAPAFLDAPALF